jgi:hypothetical protein
MRKKLRKKGYTQSEIDDVIEQMWFKQDCARLGEEEARRMRYDRAQAVEYKQYKTPTYDPLLNGLCRATGETAKAVKSTKAIVT